MTLPSAPFAITLTLTLDLYRSAPIASVPTFSLGACFVLSGIPIRRRKYRRKAAHVTVPLRPFRKLIQTWSVEHVQRLRASMAASKDAPEGRQGVSGGQRGPLNQRKPTPMSLSSVLQPCHGSRCGPLDGATTPCCHPPCRTDSTRYSTASHEVPVLHRRSAIRTLRHATRAPIGEGQSFGSRYLLGALLCVV